MWEWTEALIGSTRGLEGASWGNSAFAIFAENRNIGDVPTIEIDSIGFRIARVPEPSSRILAALGLMGFAAWGWRRKRSWR